MMFDRQPFITNNNWYYNFEQSFKELAEVSDVAKLYYDKKCKIYASYTDEEECGFHPTGKCGCLEVDDDYRFGIRCNHLMWAEGWNEFFCVEDKNGNEIDNTLYIYGNHKGGFSSILIAFDNTGECKGDCVTEIIKLDPDIDLERVKFYSQYDFVPASNKELNDERIIIRHKDGFYITANGHGFRSVDSALKLYRYLKKHPEEMENKKEEWKFEEEEGKKRREERWKKEEQERKEMIEKKKNDGASLDDIMRNL